MLAEIFLVRLETQLQSAKPSQSTTPSNNPRFVPIVLPRS